MEESSRCLEDACHSEREVRPLPVLFSLKLLSGNSKRQVVFDSSKKMAHFAREIEMPTERAWN